MMVGKIHILYHIIYLMKQILRVPQDNFSELTPPPLAKSDFTVPLYYNCFPKNDNNLTKKKKKKKKKKKLVVLVKFFCGYPDCQVQH